MTKLTVICPTRGRPHNAERLIDASVHEGVPADVADRHHARRRPRRALASTRAARRQALVRTTSCWVARVIAT